MQISDLLTLREDVLITPVTALEEEVRAKIGCGDDHFAVTRPLSRVPSSIVDADTAELLERFREPSTVVQAVILYSRKRALEPVEVLEGAYGVVRRFLESRFLVSADGNGAEAETQPSFAAGDELEGGIEIVRPLYLLEDTELHQVRLADGGRGALKIERPGAVHVAALLDREAEILRRLGGEVAPALLHEGTIDGRRYLLLEWCSGIDAEQAAAEWHVDDRPAARHHLLDLCRAIARAYARLHAAGIVHGDVHPRNLLVDRHGRVSLIDFGLARVIDLPAGPGPGAPRGGIAFFFDPEVAAAMRAGSPPPAASTAGEQYALAALLYHLVTGVHYLDFTLEREEMLRQVVEDSPVPFPKRGLDPWPEMESVLARALSKDPAERFPSIADLADELDRLGEDGSAASTASSPSLGMSRLLDEVSDDILAKLAPGGGWNTTRLEVAPTASVNYGAAGIAYALGRIAAQRDDAALLAQADLWASKALREIGKDEGFYNDEIQIGKEIVGEASPYHAPSGVFAVQALVARALADPMTQLAALEGFLGAAEAPAVGLDLTLGRSSLLVACSLLVDGLAGESAPGRQAVTDLGNRIMTEVWAELAAKPPIREADVEYLGIAHGWAGFAYAALLWSEQSAAALPAGVAERVEELAELAEPAGRGVRWPWSPKPGGNGAGAEFMSGWCNGTAGFVFLWTLAHRVFGESRYLDLAEGAGWDVCDAADPYPSLCCGLAGRAYALLNLYRHTGNREWLRRAGDLAHQGAQERSRITEYPHSLYKGELALAVLAADLERPEESAQPFFEVEGWQRGARST